jgi:hypothetical protein
VTARLVRCNAGGKGSLGDECPVPAEVRLQGQVAELHVLAREAGDEVRHDQNVVKRSTQASAGA